MLRFLVVVVVACALAGCGSGGGVDAGTGGGSGGGKKDAGAGGGGGADAGIEPVREPWITVQALKPNTLRSIWGTAPGNLYTVGDMGTIQRFDGTLWVTETSGTTKNLNSVWGLGRNDIWAVGADGTALHFDGTAWSAVPTGVTKTLNCVYGFAANDVWAAGNGVILRWNGTAWSVVPPASPFTAQIYALWGANSNDIWFVTDFAKVHWDGTAMSPFMAGKSARAMWGTSSSFIYAVGYQSIQLFNGTAWTDIAKGTLIDQVNLYAIHATGPNDIWVVGERGRTFHFDGVEWTLFPVEMTYSYYGVWMSGSSVNAVGVGGAIIKRP